MRTIPAARITAVRAVTAWCIRGVSIALVALGAYLFLKRLFFAFGLGQFAIVTRIYEGVGEGNSFYRGLALMAVGSALGLLSTRLARWMIAVPPETCPRCGYAAGGPGAAPAQCPECGLTLTG